MQPNTPGVPKEVDIKIVTRFSAVLALSVLWMLSPSRAGTTTDVAPISNSIKQYSGARAVDEGLVLLVNVFVGRSQQRGGGVAAEVTPVLLLRNGQYTDPRVEVRRIGVKRFTEQWVAGKRFVVYGNGGWAGRLENISLLESGENGSGGKTIIGQATLMGDDRTQADVSGDLPVSGTSVRQFVGRPLAVDGSRADLRETVLAPLISAQPTLNAHQIGMYLHDASEFFGAFEKRLLARGGAAEGATVLDRGKPRFIAHLDVNGDGQPETVGVFSLLVESNGRRFRFSEIIVRHESGHTEAIGPFSEDSKVDAGDIALVSFLRDSKGSKAVSLLVRVTPAWSRDGNYRLVTWEPSGWVVQPNRE